MFIFVLCYATHVCAVLCCMINFKREGLENFKVFERNRKQTFDSMSFLLYIKKITIVTLQCS